MECIFQVQGMLSEENKSKNYKGKIKKWQITPPLALKTNHTFYFILS